MSLKSTELGIGVSVWLCAIPNWPSLFAPQHRMLESFRSTHVCPPPVASWMTAAKTPRTWEFAHIFDARAPFWRVIFERKFRESMKSTKEKGKYNLYWEYLSPQASPLRVWLVWMSLLRQSRYRAGHDCLIPSTWHCHRSWLHKYETFQQPLLWQHKDMQALLGGRNRKR